MEIVIELVMGFVVVFAGLVIAKTVFLIAESKSKTDWIRSLIRKSLAPVPKARKVISLIAGIVQGLTLLVGWGGLFSQHGASLLDWFLLLPIAIGAGLCGWFSIRLCWQWMVELFGRRGSA